jgi:Fe2+ or Zn2+ uptake regulation protein
MSKYWSPQPIHTLIYEVLEKKQGNITDTDLYKALSGLDSSVSLNDMNTTLMKMEVDGLIHVYSLTKSKNRIELSKK